MNDGSWRFLIRPWLAEFASPERERAYRVEETRSSMRAIQWGVLVVVLGDLASAWFEWRTFSHRAPEHVMHLIAARIGVLVAVLGPAGIVRLWPQPVKVAWAIFGGCVVVAAMQGVVSYECHATLGQPDSPFWFGFFGFLALTVFPVPLRFGLANAAVNCAAPLYLHIAVLGSGIEELSQVVTMCLLATGMGAALANRLQRGRRHEYALLYEERHLTSRLKGEVEQRTEVAARLLEDKSELEARLAQAQHLEALGRLAGGVAHDLNNMLTPILACADLVLRELERRKEPLAEAAGEIRRAAERARDLVRQLLAFGRRQTLKTTALDLDAFVADHQRMIERLLDPRVSLRIEESGDRTVVSADSSQLGQVLINLATNANDAMSEGGVLTIRVGREDLTNDSGEVPRGSYGVLSVEDNGSGMDESTRERIFEPFFTTKEGRHSGLGLATVYGIVQQHGGTIRVQSDPGRGTRFIVFLRATAENPEVRPTSVRLRIPLIDRLETVLLVEDEVDVRRLLTQLLRPLGFTLITAANGAEALLVSRARALPIHLIVTDVVMPGMSGSELWAILREERPEAKALFVSGYSYDVLEHHPNDTRVAFLQKPFTSRDLEEKLRFLLGQKGS